jgi:hypothetical protein
MATPPKNLVLHYLPVRAKGGAPRPQRALPECALTRQRADRAAADDAAPRRHRVHEPRVYVA